MSQNITIRDDLYNSLKERKTKMNNESGITGKTQLSFSDVIDSLLESTQESLVTVEGRFDGSKALAGKTIVYKVK